MLEDTSILSHTNSSLSTSAGVLIQLNDFERQYREKLAKTPNHNIAIAGLDQRAKARLLEVYRQAGYTFGDASQELDTELERMRDFPNYHPQWGKIADDLQAKYDAHQTHLADLRQKIASNPPIERVKQEITERDISRAMGNLQMDYELGVKDSEPTRQDAIQHVIEQGKREGIEYSIPTADKRRSAMGIFAAPLKLPKMLKNKALKYSLGSTIILYGAPKVGKSGVAIYDAMENALTRKVWYIATDENMDAVKGKAQAYLLAHPEYVDSVSQNMFVTDKHQWLQDFGFEFDLANPETIRILRSEIAAMNSQGPQTIAIYIDTLKGSYSGDENQASVAQMVMDNLNGIAKDFDLATIVIHHEGHNRKMRGSSVWLAAAAQTIHAVIDSAKDAIKTTNDNVRYAETGTVSYFSRHITKVADSSGALVPMAYVEPYRPNLTLAEELYEYLLDRNEPVPTSDLKALTDKSPQAVNEALKGLHEEGKITKVSHGVWQVENSDEITA